MRQIDRHELPEMGPTMTLTALDADGPGGTPHLYRIDWSAGSIVIPFQRGPRGETSNNGVLEPALIAMMIDRLEHFERGPFPSPETTAAREHLEAALGALQDRVRNRIARGVMGQSRP